MAKANVHVWILNKRMYDPIEYINGNLFSAIGFEGKVF